MRIPVLAWAIFWFGLFVPSHERGAVPLNRDSAGPTVGAQLSSCCPPPSKDPADDSTGERARKASNCAVCFVVALLDAPLPTFSAELVLAAAPHRHTTPQLRTPASEPLTDAKPRAPPAVA